jgi:hypothetical protein
MKAHGIATIRVSSRLVDWEVVSLICNADLFDIFPQLESKQGKEMMMETRRMMVTRWMKKKPAQNCECDGDLFHRIYITLLTQVFDFPTGLAPV